MTRVAAVIQCTASDLCGSTNPEDYVVAPLLRSNLFSSVTIAAPNLGDTQRLRDQAAAWGTEFYVGHDYDVCARLLAVAERGKADIIARFILRRFYVDLDLVARMIQLVADGSDYVSCGTDVNYEVGADVSTASALKRCAKILDDAESSYDAANYRFYPWRLMEDHPSFRVARIDSLPQWPRGKALAVRERLGALLSGQGENQAAIDAGAPASRYRYLMRWVETGSVVADIACGQGGGCQVLAEKAMQVIGIDVDARYVERAIATNENERVRFICGNEDALVSDRTHWIDTVVSLHTLEHVADPVGFLRRCREALKPDGRLLLEVPRLLPMPLGMPLFPFHQVEFRPETLEPLLVSAGFEVLERLGGNRGTYGQLSTARDVLFYRARPSQDYAT